MTTYLGIDAGGSSTTVLLAEGDQVVARVRGGPGAVRPGRALAAAARIASSARRALTQRGLLQADVLVVGAAGAGREPERTELRDGLRSERLAERVTVTGDLDIALEAAFGGGPGIILISGTGSVAAGRTADGQIHRAGGHGWQIGDEGSGFALGRAGLKAAARARDGRGEATALTELIQNATPARDFDELVRWSGTADPAEIAALAPVVLRAAESGDGAAREIVDRAADQLVELVTSVLRSYGPRKQVAVALAGGNLGPERGLRRPVLERLRQVPRLTLREEEVEPAQGALAIARRQ